MPFFGKKSNAGKESQVSKANFEEDDEEANEAANKSDDNEDESVKTALRTQQSTVSFAQEAPPKTPDTETDGFASPAESSPPRQTTMNRMTQAARPQGLRVTITSATNLRLPGEAGRKVAATEDGGLNNPYAIAEMNKKWSDSARYTSPPVNGISKRSVLVGAPGQERKDVKNPVWNYEFEIKDYSKDDTLDFSIWDKDKRLKAILLGRFELEFPSYFPNGFEGSLQMKTMGITATTTMQVKVEILGPPRHIIERMARMLQKKERKKDEETHLFEFAEPLHKREEYIPDQGLAVTVICASNLFNQETANTAHVADAFVQVSIANRDDASFRTNTAMNSFSPIWNYSGQIYNYQRGDTLKFTIFDCDKRRAKGPGAVSTSQGDIIGHALLNYEDYCNGVEGRLLIPTMAGRQPGWLTVRVEVLAPPTQPEDRGPPKKEVIANQLARETKHIFLQFLRHRRGTTLRGWRLDIDRRQTNSVTYTDLMASCRKIGLSLAEARRVWRAYRPLGQGCPALPLEFAEFDPQEFDNLNSFLDVLWEELNFDIDLAWNIFDPQDKGWVSLQEFDVGMQRISFDGDVAMIFSGLDTSGQGRLWKHELDCLKLLTPESKAHPETSTVISEFKEWLQDKYRNNTETVLYDIGSRKGENHIFPVRGLAQKFQKLGFKGNALHSCMTLTRCRNSIDSKELTLIISKVILAGSEPQSCESYAGRKCTFKPAARHKHSDDITSEKPEWNNSVYDPIRLNEKLGERERYYFSRPFERPMRDNIFKQLEAERGYKHISDNAANTEKKKHLQGFSRLEKRLKRGDTGGIRAVDLRDMERVEAAIKRAEGADGPSAGGEISAGAKKKMANPVIGIQKPQEQQEEEEQAQEEEEDDQEESPMVPKFSDKLRKGKSSQKSAPSKASKIETSVAPAAKGDSSTGSFRIRVWILGGMGLADDDTDENTPEPYCNITVQGRNTVVKKSLSRETEVGKSENYSDPFVLTGLTSTDIIDFGLFDEAENGEEEECIGLSKITGGQFLPNGFEGKIGLTDDEEEPIEDTYLLLKVEAVAEE